MNEYIYEMKPEDVGLHVPSASEVKVILSDNNMLSVDPKHLEKIQNLQKKQEKELKNRGASEIMDRIKEEPISDNDQETEEDGVEINIESDEDIPLEKRKRKTNRPVRYKRRSSEEEMEEQENDSDDDDV